MEEGSNSKPRVWFEVEKIIGVSTAGNSRSYKVQWAPAWVNSFHLAGCEHLIQEFFKQNQVGKEGEQEKETHGTEQSEGISESPENYEQLSSGHSGGVGCEHVVVEDQGSEIVSTRKDDINDGDDLIENDRHVNDVGHNKNRESYTKERRGDDNGALILEEEKQCIPSAEQDLYSSTVVVVKTEDIHDHDQLGTSINPNSTIAAPIYYSDSQRQYSCPSPPRSHSNTHNLDHDRRSGSGLCDVTFSDPNGSQVSSGGPVPLGFYTCELCNKSFSDRHRLEVHIKEIHPNRSNNNFGNTALRDGNMAIQDGSTASRDGNRAVRDGNMATWDGNTERPYSCYICDKTFSAPANLRSHINTHNDVKRHECEFCHKMFRKRSNLKVHLRIHTGERPFTCSGCGKGFTTLANCTKHSQRCCAGEDMG